MNLQTNCGGNCSIPEELSEIKRSMARIEHAIAGDPAMGQPGLAQRVASLEASREEHSKRILVFTTIGTTAATAGSFVLSKIGFKFFD